MTRLRVALGGLGLVLIGTVGWLLAPKVVREPLPPLSAPARVPVEGNDETWIEVEIRPGTTFGEIAEDHGLPLQALLQAAEAHLPLTKLRPDRVLELRYLDHDLVPYELRYQADEDATLVLARRDGLWQGRLEEVVYTSVLGVKDLVVHRSLWADGLAAGIRPADLGRLAKIFEYELDFNSELEPGARLSLIGEIRSAEGHTDRLGVVHAVRLVNGDDTYVAVRFAPPGREEEYHHPDGRGLKRPFLRSPIEFSRVTSGFDRRRYHPILKETRAHNGVDLGAPTGTPVRVVADGVVLEAGRNAGHGNFVKVDHEGPYATSYSHLSAISVKKGQRVRQGDLVGKVGSTGLATGPHLHYQMWVNGAYVDPMGITLPNMSSVTDAERALFAREVARWVPLLPP